MPGMNGQETLQHLRQINPQVKVILITGREMEQVKVDFNEAELTGYLLKPFDMKDLIYTVRQYIPPPLYA